VKPASWLNSLPEAEHRIGRIKRGIGMERQIACHIDTRSALHSQINVSKRRFFLNSLSKRWTPLTREASLPHICLR